MAVCQLCNIPSTTATGVSGKEKEREVWSGEGLEQAAHKEKGLLLVSWELRWEKEPAMIWQGCHEKRGHHTQTAASPSPAPSLSETGSASQARLHNVLRNGTKPTPSGQGEGG